MIVHGMTMFLDYQHKVKNIFKAISDGKPLLKTIGLMT